MSERFQAIQTVQKIMEEKAFFNTLKEAETSAFINMLVLTVLRRMVGLEEILSRFVKLKFKKSEQILKYLLVCGAAEILYLDTPDYAAVSEYVALTKKACGKFASGMVNAVLRKIATQKPKSDKVFPASFQKILEEDYTPEQIKKMEIAALSEAPLDLSVKEDPTLWAEKLNATIFESKTLRLKTPGRIESLPGFKEGAWWVQDLASALPIILLGDVKNKKVLDLCAAPGGKTAQLLSAGAEVLALDINPERMTRLEQNIKRLHLEKNLTTRVSDGLKFLEQTTDIFDIILLDAPCSATGTFRRHPEVMHFKTLEDVNAQIPLQQKLLSAAAKHVAKGGFLLYCTCSLSKKEGEQQIKHFLAQNPTFHLHTFSKDNFLTSSTVQKLEKNIFDNQVLRTLPYDMAKLGGMDGFFAAYLKKD